MPGPTLVSPASTLIISVLFTCRILLDPFWWFWSLRISVEILSLWKITLQLCIQWGFLQHAVFNLNACMRMLHGLNLSFPQLQAAHWDKANCIPAVQLLASSHLLTIGRSPLNRLVSFLTVPVLFGLTSHLLSLSTACGMPGLRGCSPVVSGVSNATWRTELFPTGSAGAFTESAVSPLLRPWLWGCTRETAEHRGLGKRQRLRESSVFHSTFKMLI